MHSRELEAASLGLIRISLVAAFLSLGLLAVTPCDAAATATNSAPAKPTATTPANTVGTGPQAVPSTSPASKTPSANQAPSNSQGDYLIGPGDTLEVFVWREPDLTVSVPVRPDGKTSIPLVEDIECAGKTPSQLAQEIQDRLKKFVNDPVVTVIVQNIGGEVLATGSGSRRSSSAKIPTLYRAYDGARCDDRCGRAYSIRGG